MEINESRPSQEQTESRPAKECQEPQTGSEDRETAPDPPDDRSDLSPESQVAEEESPEVVAGLKSTYGERDSWWR
ncbi:MAG: hypothetical protein AB1758_37565, partial [Candidatus Eremiobacterota bacterium]